MAVLVYLLMTHQMGFVRDLLPAASTRSETVASLPSSEPATQSAAGAMQGVAPATQSAQAAEPAPAQGAGQSPEGNSPGTNSATVAPTTASAPVTNTPATNTAAANTPASNTPATNTAASNSAAANAPATNTPTNTPMIAVPPSPAVATATPAVASPSVPSGPGPEPVETLPPQATGALLGDDEVRYCVFQGRRLTYLRNQVVGDDPIQRFNTLVADFNSRCRSFRYDNNALQTASQQADTWHDQIKSDAQAILASWSPGMGSPVVAGSLIDLQSHEGAAKIQARLKELGYYDRRIDGQWGPKSASALATFRQDKGLGANGIWDITTQTALLGQ
jgi:hypothetical protein